MAPRDTSSKPKRTRTRKTRTADPISSSDSSSSESDSKSSPEPQQPVAKKPKTSEPQPTKSSKSKTKKRAVSASPTPDTEIPATAQEAINATRQPSSTAAEDAFTTYYLRQITTNFADDLEKIRGASDFKANSLPMLIEALSQGRSCFRESERVGVGRAVLAAEESSS